MAYIGIILIIFRGVVYKVLFAKQGCGKVAFRRIWEDGDDGLAFPQFFGQLQCGRYIGPAGNPA